MDIENYKNKKKSYNAAYMPEYRKSRAETLKQQHRCTRCGGKDEYTLSGRSHCKLCCDKDKAYRMGQRAEPKQKMTDSELEQHIREYRRNYMKDFRAFRRKHKYCIQCGCEDALTMNGMYLCQSCYEKKYKHPYVSKQERVTDVVEKIIPENHTPKPSGICRLCNSPVKSGTVKWSGEPYKVCEHHYELLCDALKKGREAYARKYGKTYGQYRYEWEHPDKVQRKSL